MVKLKLAEEVRNLPAKQQIAVWVILTKFSKKKYTFLVSDFAEEMKKYLSPKNMKDLARIMGGVLSSLVRNGMIEQLTGGRNIIWTINPEIKKNAKEYSKLIFPVVTYWEK